MESLATKENFEEKRAFNVNRKKSLYCEECCMYFEMDEDGIWRKTSDPSQVADLVADSFLQCTCGRNLAVKVKKETVIGEFLALR